MHSLKLPVDSLDYISVADCIGLDATSLNNTYSTSYTVSVIADFCFQHGDSLSTDRQMSPL